MFIIISYDVNEKRCKKFNKLLKNYLFHVANSVFHGEITESKYKSLLISLDKIKIEEDRIIIYELPKKNYLNIKYQDNKLFKVVY